MGAGASTKLADAPDPVPKDVAERTLGVTLDAAEWAARADADGRVSQARLLAESDKVARADEFFRDLGEFFRFRKDIDALWASQDGREALEAVEAVDKVKVDHRYEAVGQQVAPRTRAPVDSVAELYEAAEMARPAFEVVLRRCAGAGVLKVAPLKGQVRARVEINRWFGTARPNFRTLELRHIDVDSADFWTNRSLSSSSRSTTKERASKRSHTRTLKSG